MKAQDLMTRNPACCTPDDTLEQVARMMRENDCGAIPVCESENPGEVVGMVTDRDLAVRGFARGAGPEAHVRECMSTDVHACEPEATADEVADVMVRHRVRRVPIIDTDGRLLGIVAQADLARAAEQDIAPEDLADLVEAISRAADRRAGQ